MKKVTWLIVALSLSLTFHASATDYAGELAECTAGCYHDWLMGQIFCNFLTGNEKTECLQNNDAGYNACIKLCHLNYPEQPGE